MENDKQFYIVNCKTGDVYGKAGSFGCGVPKSFKKLVNAFSNAQTLANYYRIETRVDDQDGKEICRCVPKER